MRLRRTVSVAAVAVVAMAGLSACQSKVGLAASVSGTHLSDTALSGYVKPGAASYTDQGSNTPVVPKLFALETWIDSTLFSNAVAKKGGAPTAAQFTAARNAVLGSQTAASINKIYSDRGYTTKFGELIVRSNTTLVLLVQRIAPGISATQAISALQGGQAGAELLKAVNATKPKVVVSTRYGKWDPARVTLTSTAGAGAPGFIRFGATAAATPTAPAP